MKTNCHDCGEVIAKCVCGRYPKPYLHDANATKEDTTPGGPMTRSRGPRSIGGRGDLASSSDTAMKASGLDDRSPQPTSGGLRENLFTPNSIRTVGGRYINLLEPDPDTLLIEDIAHALAHMPRFGGHLPVFYSVAEHSTGSRFLVPDEDAFAALMHDASEAYLMDIPRPLKMLIPQYAAIEQRFMEVLSRKFGFAFPLPPSVKKADEQMLHEEWFDLMLGTRPVAANKPLCFTPAQAKRNFLEVFEMCRPK